MNLIGIDMGGTSIKGGVFNGKSVSLFHRLPTKARRPASAIIEDLVALVRRLDPKGKSRVGICLPGYVHNNKLLSAPNLPTLQGKDVAGLLRARLRRPIALENDANCFALAEARVGNAAKHAHSVGIIVGTGLGSGIIIDGNIYGGATGGAGEIGHSYYDTDKSHKFEYMTSGGHIMARYHKAGGKKAQTPAAVFASSEPKAKAVVEKTYQHLAVYISHVLNMLNPGVVVVGGGLSPILNLTKLRRYVKRYAYGPNFAAATICKAKIDPQQAGIIGAALHAKEQ